MTLQTKFFLLISQRLITIGPMLLSKLYIDVTIAVIFLYQSNLHDLQKLKYKNSY